MIVFPYARYELLVSTSALWVLDDPFEHASNETNSASSDDGKKVGRSVSKVLQIKDFCVPTLE